VHPIAQNNAADPETSYFWTSKHLELLDVGMGAEGMAQCHQL
jgi:hypothetical protein